MEIITYRILTRENLARRGVLAWVVSLNCVFCNRGWNRLPNFLHCHFIFIAWSEILGWLEINFITPLRLFEHFEFLEQVFG